MEYIANKSIGFFGGSMSFLWPTSMFLLGVIPVLIIIYIWILHRRRRFAVRYSSLVLVRDVLPRRATRRQHIPFALFLLALASLGIALGRPYSVVSVPADQTVIILALDVSRSMCSTDITPNRLRAAEDAALAFTRLQKPTTQIGVVAFSGFAELIQPPTADPERLQSAIEGLLLGSTTAIGSGILKSLDAIAEIDPNVFPSQPIELSSTSDGEPDSAATSQPDSPASDLPLQPDIIILLTDGVNNTGPQPLDAARQATERGVRVYTIGYGTPAGSLYPDCPPKLMSNDPNGGFILGQVDNTQAQGVGAKYYDQEMGYVPLAGGVSSGGGGTFSRGIDEDTLKKVAAVTGGTYSSAESASQLQQVFAQLPVARIMHRAINELSVAFTALGACLAALAIVLSILWRPV